MRKETKLLKVIQESVNTMVNEKFKEDFQKGHKSKINIDEVREFLLYPTIKMINKDTKDLLFFEFPGREDPKEYKFNEIYTDNYKHILVCSNTQKEIGVGHYKKISLPENIANGFLISDIKKCDYYAVFFEGDFIINQEFIIENFKNNLQRKGLLSVK